MTYLDNLKKALTESGYGSRYTKLIEQYCNRLINNGLPVIFDNKHLSLLLGVDSENLGKIIFLSDSLYTQARIPKKSGTYREISIPTVNLKHIQRWILDTILSEIRVSNHAMGFIKDRSIKDNALPHVNKECVITLDIENFFPTIKFDTIFKIFSYYGYTKEVSYSLTKLCTLRGVLPQGAPTSPYLSNIVCLKLDKRFSMLANNINASYTRYADDLTLSGNKDILKYIPVFKSIITDEGFNINQEKVRVQVKPNRQVVTGLIVNEKVSVSNKYKRYLSHQFHFCEKFGVDNHLQHNGINKSHYKEHLYGIAYFIKMVDEELGNIFLRKLNNITWDY